MDTLDSEMIINDDEACRFKDQRKRTLDLLATCVVNSCLGKVTRVLFRLNDSIHQPDLTLDVIQVLDGRNYFQSC